MHTLTFKSFSSDENDNSKTWNLKSVIINLISDFTSWNGLIISVGIPIQVQHTKKVDIKIVNINKW